MCWSSKEVTAESEEPAGMAGPSDQLRNQEGAVKVALVLANNRALRRTDREVHEALLCYSSVELVLIGCSCALSWYIRRAQNQDIHENSLTKIAPFNRPG